MKIFSKFLLLLVFINYSCNDAIDIFEPGTLNDGAVYRNVTDLQNGLLGVMIDMDHTQDMFFHANYTDEVTRGPSNGGQGENGFNLILANNFAESFVFYSKYSRVNMIAQRVLENAARITPTAAEQATYNNIIGSLKGISAYCHFMMMAYYSTSYTDNSALAIPIINFVPSVTLKPRRNTVGEVSTFINDELIAASNLLSAQANKNFISKDFCTALRARLAAYRQDYPLASTLSQSLFASYPIANVTQYESMWGTGLPPGHNEVEVIFQLARTQGDRYDRQSGAGGNGTVNSGGRAGNTFAFTNRGPGGGPFFTMNRGLYNSFPDNDIRKTLFIHPNSTINANWDNQSNPNLDRLVIDKFKAKQTIPLLSDLRIFRSSEMHMIYIESLIAANNLSLAAQQMQNFRNNRFTSAAPLPSYSSQQAAYEDLLLERRREFCFEGHRWFDLKRLGQRAGVSIQRAANECTFWSWANCTIPANDFRFTLPIPQHEMDNNPNMVQNSGY